MVDGMGIAGVEGVFRRCCEKTMVLMRAHQEELRTIVEVSTSRPYLLQWFFRVLSIGFILHLKCLMCNYMLSRILEFNDMHACIHVQLLYYNI